MLEGRSRMSTKYIEKHQAGIEDLKPGVRLYVKGAINTYVARIDLDGWAAYWGHAIWELDWVADHGLKIAEDFALKIFPICKTAGLSYKKPTVRELAAKHKLQVKESSDTIDLVTGKRISSNE